MALSTIYAYFEKEEPAVTPIFLLLAYSCTCHNSDFHVYTMHCINPLVTSLYPSSLSPGVHSAKTLISHGVPHSPNTPNQSQSIASLYIHHLHLTSSLRITSQQYPTPSLTTRHTSPNMSSSPVTITPAHTLEDYRRKSPPLPLSLFIQPTQSSRGPSRQNPTHSTCLRTLARASFLVFLSDMYRYFEST